MNNYIYSIPTGILNLKVEEGNPSSLFQVESRKNPKRGFLFVSKVLGKHIPVNIEKIDATHQSIADQILPRVDKTKKTIVIGMAETATLLGYGVYKKLEMHFESDLHYIFSTRIPHLNAIPFEESHSHAPSQFIHLDQRDYEQVILIDDELSTGNTFLGFEEILKENLPNLENIIWGCITDFRKSDIKKSQKNIEDVISLLKGEWSFEWTNKPEKFSASENIHSVNAQHVIKYGRYKILNKDTQYIFNNIENLKNLEGKILVLGTGEFMPFPYFIAKSIKNENNEIYFQATTRSPSDMKGYKWNTDHYNEGVEQFLYNYDRSLYDHVLLFVENEENQISIEMAQSLNAKLISLKS